MNTNELAAAVHHKCIHADLDLSRVWCDRYRVCTIATYHHAVVCAAGANSDAIL